MQRLDALLQRYSQGLLAQSSSSAGRAMHVVVVGGGAGGVELALALRHRLDAEAMRMRGGQQASFSHGRQGRAKVT